MNVLRNSNTYTPKGIGPSDESDDSSETLKVVIEGEPVEETDNEVPKDITDEHYKNLIDELSQEQIVKIVNSVVSNYKSDLESRSEWENIIKAGLDNLGLKIEELDEPFEGACSIQHPIIIENAIEFQSKASAELLPSDGPVKTKIRGKQTDAKINKALRVGKFMNQQLTTTMEDYYEDMEKLLLYLPMIGSCFKKTYYDSEFEQPCSKFLDIDNFVINDGVSSLRKASWYTEVIPITDNELEYKYSIGEYRRPLNTKPRNSTETYDGTSSMERGNLRIVIDEMTGLSTQNLPKTHKILEQHINLVLDEPVGDGSGRADPYVVSVLEETNQLLSIRRNWKKGDYLRKKIIWYVHYPFIPGLGFHGLGYFHLLSNTQYGLTAISRALIDAGMFANLPAGFKKKGTKVLNDEGLSFGEWREVEYYGEQSIDKVLMPLNYKEPSQTLFALFQHFEQRLQRFADTTKQVVADSTNYGPVGTTMALLQHSNRLFSAIHKRLHKAQKQELKLLQRINYDYLSGDALSFHTTDGEEYEISREDFNPDNIDVEPVSDPDVSSEVQRLSVASAKLDAALKNPSIHDMRAIYREFYMTLGVDNIDTIMPPQDEAQPNDPMTDIIMVTQGKPIRAFPGQDHASHIKFKEIWLKDPTQGASEIMRPFVPQILANVREHVLLDFKTKVEGTAKVEGNAEGAVNEAVMAEAAQKVFEANKFMKEQNQDGDPVSKIAQAALLEAQAELLEVQRKKTMDNINAILKNDANLIAAQKEANRAQEANRALAVDLTKVGLDATTLADKTKEPKATATKKNGSGKRTKK